MAIDDIIKKIVPQVNNRVDLGYVRPGNNPQQSTLANIRNRTTIATPSVGNRVPGVRIEPVKFGKNSANKINWNQKLSTFTDKIVPYISNVANVLTSPTGPRQPETVTATRIPKPNFDATRNQIVSSESAIAKGADQSLGGNAATAVKLGARAQTLGALNQVAETESNAVSRTAAQQAQMDMQASYINATNRNAFQNDLQEYGNTIKTQRLANLSNFADKIVAAGNVESANELDKKKFALISQMYNKGLVGRQLTQLEALSKTLDPQSIMKKGGRLLKYKV